MLFPRQRDLNHPIREEKVAEREREREREREMLFTLGYMVDSGSFWTT